MFEILAINGFAPVLAVTIFGVTSLSFTTRYCSFPFCV